LKVPEWIKPRLYHSAYQRAWFTLFGVVIKEVRVAFAQFFTWRYPFFSFLNALAVVLSSLARLVLGRSLKYSFSFTGEDRILESLIKKRISENGFYVEVGCNHPKFLSNTYSFYRKGWRGLCIDANPKFDRLFQKYRPKDIFVNALVSNTETEREFYTVKNDVLSTVDFEVASNYQKEGLGFEMTKLRTYTLAGLLLKNNVSKDFDLLIVDAEEHDREVLAGMDWDNFRPKWVVVEDENWHCNSTSPDTITHYMEDKGYKLQGFLLSNLYFLRKG
jgi:thiol-disulfide isomerase/thioredoxin